MAFYGFVILGVSEFYGWSVNLEDTDYAESHLPGLYFYLSVDLGRTTNKYSESRRVFCSFAGSKNPL